MADESNAFKRGPATAERAAVANALISVLPERYRASTAATAARAYVEAIAFNLVVFIFIL